MPRPGPRAGLSALALALLLATGCDRGGAPAPTGEKAPDPNSLSQRFAQAVESIRRNQNPEGHWDTPVTLTTVYEGAKPEVNTFTPAILVDLLDPIAEETGLKASLDRARAYLGRQVEATGLARYHGDPGKVDPSVLGCELPPDADDTALIWRIAPPADPERLRAARGTLEEYRTKAGLYLTWLASQQRYRCFFTRFFPKNPNPPDVAIQMHVYLLLARHDAAAAGRLCAALRSRIADERLWVWYAVAPLLPLWREIDLARAGCPLKVPESQLKKAVAGQEPYMTLATVLRDLAQGADPRASRDVAVRTLEGLAAGGFAQAKKNPPLLYHNALSAEPPHYHWSDEVGRALWLRVYVELRRLMEDALPAPARRPSPPG